MGLHGQRVRPRRGRRRRCSQISQRRRILLLQLPLRLRHSSDVPEALADHALQHKRSDMLPQVMAILPIDQQGSAHVLPRGLPAPAIRLDLVRRFAALPQLQQHPPLRRALPIVGRERQANHLLGHREKVHEPIVGDMQVQAARRTPHGHRRQVHPECLVAMLVGESTGWKDVLLEGLVDDCKGFSQRQDHSVIRIPLLPPIDAPLHHPLLHAILALRVALQDDRDDQVENHEGDEERVAHPKHNRPQVHAEDGRHACIWNGALPNQAFRLQHIVAGGQVKQVVRGAPIADAEPRQLILPQVVHELVPGLASGGPEERDYRPAEVLEVAMHIQRLSEFDEREQVRAQDAI
mmetsp:Transcript_94429/g.266752  ORF Transcript_94429/g.266752 Transcript_94429/m.266752 type:complete len:350 (+) Transcript_94429:189-1238(+)